MKRGIIILIILVVIIGGSIATYTLITPETYTLTEDPAIEVLTVKQDTLLATVNAAGQLEAIDTVNLGFEVNADVIKIYVEEGDLVAEGDLLAELDATDLTEAVELAEIDLTKAQAQLDSLQETPSENDLAAAQFSLESAKANLEILLNGPSDADIKATQTDLDSTKASLQQVLSGPNADSITVALANLRKSEIALRQAQQAYDEVAYDSRAANFQGLTLQQATIDHESALANYNLAIRDAESAEILAGQARVAAAEAKLVNLLATPDPVQIYNAQTQVAQAESALQKLLDGPTNSDMSTAQSNVEAAQIRIDQAKRNLERTKLYSSIAGTVTALNLKEGEAPTNPVAISIADLSTFKLEVEIDEIDIHLIEAGQPTVIALDSLPDNEYTGEVDQISVAPANTTSSIVAYAVTILLNEEDTAFKIGMNVNATIETERLEDIVVIQNRAVQIDRETGKAYVEKLIDDDTTELVEITLGLRDNTVSEVTSGLTVGDTIIIRQVSRRDQLRNAFGGDENN